MRPFGFGARAPSARHVGMHFMQGRRVHARGGVYVPSDSFGGQSPERKAAGIMRTFFTFVSARIVLAQLEGSGRGALGAYDSQAATDLQNFLQQVPMKDGDEWLAALMKKNTSLGLRLMEVRDHYCAEAFEWEHLQRIARQDMKGANTKLMRQFAAASLAASLAAERETGIGSAAAAAAADAGSDDGDASIVADRGASSRADGAGAGDADGSALPSVAAGPASGTTTDAAAASAQATGEGRKLHCNADGSEATPGLEARSTTSNMDGGPPAGSTRGGAGEPSSIGGDSEAGGGGGSGEAGAAPRIAQATSSPPVVGEGGGLGAEGFGPPDKLAGPATAPSSPTLDGL